MSERALVAAIRPKSKGSSTMGMKKSVVATIAWSSFRRYTAASSEVSAPTSKSGKCAAGNAPCKSSDRIPGEILQPQPPPCESDVNRGVGEGAGGAFIESRLESG